MIILAHRGWWETPEERNGLAAFRRGFDAGYGAELDVRDLNGAIVVSHDPPVDGALLLEQVLELYSSFGMPGRLAINIKADGLCSWIKDLLARYDVTERTFVFDASVPDMRSYLEADLPVFTRVSEVEPIPAFYARCQGVWLDSFDETGASIERAIDDLSNGKDVAMVSPDLHRRPHADAWDSWSASLRRKMPAGATSGQLMICTDHPKMANEQFAWLQTEDAV